MHYAVTVTKDISDSLAVSEDLREQFFETYRTSLQPALDILDLPEIQERQFHNKAHTFDVVEAVMVIWSMENDIPLARVLDNPKPEFTELLFAAVYHDVGHKDGAKGHEQRSAEIAREALSSRLGPDFAQRVANLILCTRMEPKDGGGFGQVAARTRSEQILQDADMFNLGSTDWKTQNGISQALFQEMNPGSPYTTSYDHLKNCVKIFENHEFQTASARSLLGSRKADNYAYLVASTLSMQLRHSDFCTFN